MRPIADCVEHVQALGRPVRAILVDSEAEDYSAWWQVSAILERQPSVAPLPLRWIEHEHFEYHEVEMSPVFQTTGEAERAASIELGQALAKALGVPSYVVPPEVGGAHIGWLAQSQSVRLVEHLENARHLVVLSGRHFAPVQARGSTPYRDLLASAEARARHWAAKVDHWQRVQEWQQLQSVWPDANPYRALVDLDRRGILEGVIDETPFGHLQLAGLGAERIAQIHGSLTEVECLRCGTRAPSTPAIDEFRRGGQIPRCACGGSLKLAAVSFGQDPAPHVVATARQFCQRADLVVVLGSRLAIEPCASIVLEPVRAGRAPLVIIGYEETNADREASLVINEDCEKVLPFAMRRTTQ